MTHTRARKASAETSRVLSHVDAGRPREDGRREREARHGA